MIPLGQDEYTIVRAPLVENSRDGASYRDWANAVSTPVTGAKVNPFQLAEKLNFEINAEREYTRTGIKFFAPPGSLMPEPTDRVVYRGNTYSVFGHPMMWTDFDGNDHHIEFVAQLKEG